MWAVNLNGDDDLYTLSRYDVFHGRSLACVLMQAKPSDCSVREVDAVRCFLYYKYDLKAKWTVE